MRLVWLSVMASALAGCGIADFNLSEPIPAGTIPGSSKASGTVVTIPLDLDLTQQLSATSTGPASSLTLASLDLTVTSTGDGASWGFVDTVAIAVASTKPGSTLPTVTVATARGPGDVQILPFDVDSSIDLLPYINEGSKTESTATGTVPAHDIDYDGSSEFTVDPL